MDEKKRIIEFDAAESVPVDGQLPIDSASQGTKKITPALLLKAITDLLGDEALETLAQTITGAVNEVKGIADDAQDLAENISDEYSSSSAYAKGDYCIHNNTLYKCTTAIGSGGEAWNASHWIATKCDDELSELKGTLGDLSAVKAYTNALTISFDMEEAPTATHFGAYILFNANQGVIALVKAETNPGVHVIIGSNPMTVTLNGKTITITPTNRLWGLTVVMGCEANFT